MPPKAPAAPCTTPALACRSVASHGPLIPKCDVGEAPSCFRVGRLEARFGEDKRIWLVLDDLQREALKSTPAPARRARVGRAMCSTTKPIARKPSLREPCPWVQYPGLIRWPGRSLRGGRACPPNCTPLHHGRGCADANGLPRGPRNVSEPWPTLNLHVHFPKRAHHQPMGLGWGAVTDSSFSPLSHLNSITAHDALHRGDCPALRVMAEDSHRRLLQGSRCSKSRGQRALSINCVRKKGSCADVRASNNVPVAGPFSHRFMMMTAVWGPLRDGNLATGLRS